MRLAGLLLLLVLGGCVRSLPPSMMPDVVLRYETPDGWKNGLRRYHGEGEPVLLVHGMGANHYNWDYREEVSLAAYLQAHGWDVWVIELRGGPGSAHADPAAAGRFTFDDHARLDLPAAIDRILEVTGRDELYWVGHSMGGMLLYTHLAQRPDQVAAGVAVCSPSTLQHPLPLHRSAKAMAWTLKGEGRVPARTLAGISRPLGRANPLYGKLANRKNLEWPVAHGLARHALVDLPKPLLAQALTWVEHGDLITVDGEPWVRPANVPLLVFGAASDRIVAHQDAAYTCEVFPNCTYRLLGVEGGFSLDYGHIDPVVGRSARREVYPLILQFLEDQRRARETRRAAEIASDRPQPPEPEVEPRAPTDEAEPAFPQ